MLITAALATLAMAAPAAPANAEVSVWDSSGSEPRRCSAIDASSVKRLKGGCVIPVKGRAVDMTLQTMVGDIEIEDCRYPHRLRVDGSGRTFMEGLAEKGHKPCNDMDTCMTNDRRPWRGQIHHGNDGGFYHVVQACFDTCMGQFRGELKLRLTRTADGWRQTVSEDLLDDTGFELDNGSWELEPDTIDIRGQGR